MKCPHCHSDNADTARFCAECGTSFTPSPGPASKGSGTHTFQTPIKELTTGSTFAGRYQVVEELGRGGMGRVYKVFDQEVQAKMALKLIKPEVSADKNTIDRFRNELKIARDISHKNICRMYDLGREAGNYFITMEYVSGEDLKSFIRRSRQLVVGTAILIAEQVCEGLVEAHRLGVVHRDLKPGNIMIDKEGNAKIMDFGIARSISAKGITGAGVMIGTPEYMSPEQVEGKEVDKRSDIYSLGIILYEMLTGQVPFEGDTPFTVGVKQKSETPKDPRSLNAQIPQDLSRLVLKCLEKDKERRYQNADELRASLEKIEKGIPTAERPVPKRKTATAKPLTLTISRKKLFVPLSMLIAIAIIGIGLWSFLPKRHVAPPLPSGKPSLAIVYFENISGDKGLDAWKTGLTELLITKLSQSKFINVLSSDRIFGILKRLNLQEAKKYSTEDLVKVADEGGAVYTLSGSLMKAGKTIIMTLTLQKPRTGEVISPLNIECHGEEEIFPKVDELARTIKSDMNLTPDQIATDIDKEAGKITTNSPEAYKYYCQGRLYHERGDYEQSIALMEKAVLLDPGFAMAYRKAGAAYFSLGYYTKSKYCTMKALELSDRISEKERLIIQGDFYSTTEKTYDKAIDVYERLLELYPEANIANNNLGLIYSELEDLDKASERFEMGIKIKYDAVFPNYANLARIYCSWGMYEKARQILEEYAKDFSDNARLRGIIAFSYLCEGKYDLAESEANKAFSLGPTDYRNMLLNGEIRYLKGNLIEAEKEWLKSVDIAPKRNKADGTFRLAFIYSLAGKFEKSKNQLNKVIELSKETAEVEWEVGTHFHLAANALNINNFADALKACDEGCEKAIEGENLSWQRFIIHMKGLVYLRMKSLDKAQKTAEELREFIEKGLCKKDIRLYHHLQGLIELARKNYSKSIEHLNKAVSSLYAQSLRSFWDALFLDSLARAYSAEGDQENAQKEYKKILSLTYGRFYWGDIYARSYYNLGIIYERQGQKDSARENYRKFLDLWKDADAGLPEVADAKARLARLGT